MTVAAATAADLPAGRDRTRDRRVIRIWLYSIAVLVLVMVAVGGATRLTESGLSITEWNPVLGTIPPLDEAAWLEEFANYRAIPEFQLNPDMTLAEFQRIFWWEWSHRFLARLIGVAFLAPLVWLWATGRIERGLRPQLVVTFILGGLQGAVGWWMVASGLTERTDVSQYRLAAHLILASLIFAYLIWVARGLRPERPYAAYSGRSMKVFGVLLLVLVFLQLYLGGLVAGLNAGFQYNDWPTIGGAVVPQGLFAIEPWWRNLFENPLTVQFDHRIVAYLLAALIFAHGVYLARRMPGSRLAWSAYRLLALVVLQVVLGVATLVSAVPIGLALLHQFTAMLLLAGAVLHLRGMYPPVPVRDGPAPAEAANAA